MTDQMDPEMSDGDTEMSPRLEWEVPEIAATVVLLAFGALAIGGLVAGVVASAGQSVAFQASSLGTGEAINFGAAWAEPLLAVALLGVVGLSWWQTEAWSAAGEGADHDNDDSEALGHIRRARRIGLAAEVALIVTVAGSVADLVGIVMEIPGNGALNWARYIITGASLIGVLAVAAGGWIIGQKARTKAGEAVE
jgi:hypothetical protein